MARFVSFHDGLVGSLQRTLELGRRLTDAGHDFVLAGPVDVRADAARVGLDAVHLDRLDALRAELDALPRPGRDTRRPTDVVRWLRAGRRTRRASLQDDSVTQLLRDVDPDLVLVELEYHTAAIAALGAGRRVALTTGFFSTLPSSTNPPLDSSLRPGVDAPESIAAAWDETIAEHRRVRRRAVWSASGVAAPLRPVRPVTWNPVDLAAVARSHGMRLRDLVHDEQWLRPFALDRLPIVSFTPEALEFGPTPPRWHTVGTMLPPVDAAVDRTSSADRAAMAALRVRRARHPRPLVVVGVGTYWGAAASLLRRIVEACGRLVDVDVVVGLGGRTDRATVGPIPGHVTVLDWAPQAELLAEADLAIVHGGVTTLTECARAGVPMICCPTHTNEQDGNVARVVHAGVATSVDHRVVTVDELAALTERSLADAELRTRAATLSERIRDGDAGEPALRLLESLAS